MPNEYLLEFSSPSHIYVRPKGESKTRKMPITEFSKMAGIEWVEGIKINGGLTRAQKKILENSKEKDFKSHFKDLSEFLELRYIDDERGWGVFTRKKLLKDTLILYSSEWLLNVPDLTEEKDPYLLRTNIDNKIFSSQYKNLKGNFFSAKQIRNWGGFINHAPNETLDIVVSEGTDRTKIAIANAEMCEHSYKQINIPILQLKGSVEANCQLFWDYAPIQKQLVSKYWETHQMRLFTLDNQLLPFQNYLKTLKKATFNYQNNSVAIIIGLSDLISYIFTNNHLEVEGTLEGQKASIPPDTFFNEQLLPYLIDHVKKVEQDAGEVIRNQFLEKTLLHFIDGLIKDALHKVSAFSPLHLPKETEVSTFKNNLIESIYKEFKTSPSNSLKIETETSLENKAEEFGSFAKAISNDNYSALSQKWPSAKSTEEKADEKQITADQKIGSTEESTENSSDYCFRHGHSLY